MVDKDRPDNKYIAAQSCFITGILAIAIGFFLLLIFHVSLPSEEICEESGSEVACDFVGAGACACSFSFCYLYYHRKKRLNLRFVFFNPIATIGFFWGMGVSFLY